MIYLRQTKLQQTAIMCYLGFTLCSSVSIVIRL